MPRVRRPLAGLMGPRMTQNARLRVRARQGGNAEATERFATNAMPTDLYRPDGGNRSGLRRSVCSVIENSTPSTGVTAGTMYHALVGDDP